MALNTIINLFIKWSLNFKGSNWAKWEKNCTVLMDIFQLAMYQVLCKSARRFDKKNNLFYPIHCMESQIYLVIDASGVMLPVQVQQETTCRCSCTPVTMKILLVLTWHSLIRGSSIVSLLVDVCYLNVFSLKISINIGSM